MKESKVASGQWLGIRGQGSGVRGQGPQIPRSPNLQISKSPNLQISKSPNLQISKSPNLQISKFSSGFTLIELLVTITIIGILASMALGVMQAARQVAAQAATTATITKLNNIIMRRYESYLTRRVPLRLVYPKGNPKEGQPLSPADAAKDRLYAMRDMIRMEMPDRATDILSDPIELPNSQQRLLRPAINNLYYNRLTSPSTKPGTSVGDGCTQAEMLYLIVSLGFARGDGTIQPVGDRRY